MDGRILWIMVTLAGLSVIHSGCRRKIADGKADGAAIFKEVCARCHGPDGVPDPGTVARIGVKALNSPEVRQLSDEQIRRQIDSGSDNRQMPSFSGALSSAQMQAVVHHVRVLQGMADPPAVPPAAAPPDPSAD